MTSLREDHIQEFKRVDVEVWAPGRINLIGEHTDYNDGLVLPAAIDCGIRMWITRADKENEFRLYSKNLNDWRSFGKSDPTLPNNNWAKYLQALIQVIKEKENVEVPYFNVSLESNIPTGGGLSSSAALNAGFLTAINEMLEMKWSSLQMAKLAQWTEHKIGLNVGLMDPYAIFHGEDNAFTFLDCQTEKHEIVPAHFDDYVLLLVDTMVSHNLASSEYNLRRATCEKVVKAAQSFTSATSLRDLTKEDLKRVEKEFSSVSTTEAHYILEENARVEAAVSDLQNGRFEELGRLMFESHQGLKVKYRVSCSELDFLVDFALQSPEVLGARMMGGGFGGSTINLIHSSDVDLWEEKVKNAYLLKYQKTPNTLIVKPSKGARVVK